MFELSFSALAINLSDGWPYLFRDISMSSWFLPFLEEFLHYTLGFPKKCTKMHVAPGVCAPYAVKFFHIFDHCTIDFDKLYQRSWSPIGLYWNAIRSINCALHREVKFFGFLKGTNLHALALKTPFSRETRKTLLRKTESVSKLPQWHEISQFSYQLRILAEFILKIHADCRNFCNTTA